MTYRESTTAAVAVLALLTMVGPLACGSGEDRGTAAAAAPSAQAKPGGGGGGGTQSVATSIVQMAAFWVDTRFSYDRHKSIPLDPMLNHQSIAKAEPDECFLGVGVTPGVPPCDSTAKPKVNDAYVWGLTRAGEDLWFGTVANTLCYAQTLLGVPLSPEITSDWVCEFGKAASGSDWRAPNVFRYDTVEQMPYPANPGDANPEAEALRHGALGFRSAGSEGTVVFLAGPGWPESDGIVMLAYDAATHALIGATRFPEYSNIRSWVTVGSQLYTGVGKRGGGGEVLRWSGSKDPAHVFDFEVVGVLDSEAANLVLHEGRIYLTTWPGTYGPPMSLYRGPVVGEGLSAADQGAWVKIWSFDQYEKDPVNLMVTGGGAVASFGGALYWSTLHMPFTPAAYAPYFFDLDANGNGQLDTDEILATALGTHRSAELFQGTGLATTSPKIKLVYGEAYLPLYDPALKAYRIAYDAAHRNAGRYTPVLGASGFGNFFNGYVWSSAKFGDQLYLGTFDWTRLARTGLADMVLGTAPGRITGPLMALIRGILPPEGGDLYRLPSATQSAIAESLDGLGNDTNYGFRTMETDGQALYVGTANPMNVNPAGGWELFRLTP